MCLTPEEIAEINEKTQGMELKPTQSENTQPVAQNNEQGGLFDPSALGFNTSDMTKGAIGKNKDKIEDMVEQLTKENIKAEFEKAMLNIAEKKKVNKVVKQKIQNELLESKKQGELLKRQAKHEKRMQKLQQRKELNADFIERNHLNGDESKFSWCWFKCIDFIKQNLSKTIEITGLANKIVRRTLIYIIIAICIFVEPVRTFLLGLIGG